MTARYQTEENPDSVVVVTSAGSGAIWRFSVNADIRSLTFAKGETADFLRISELRVSQRRAEIYFDSMVVGAGKLRIMSGAHSHRRRSTFLLNLECPSH